MKRLHAPDRPVCFAGKVVLEFFNNSDEDFKRKALRDLTRDLRKEWNVSCAVVEEYLVENPERGALAIALVGVNHDKARALWDEAVKFLDGRAPARIVSEDFQEGEIE